MIFWIVIAVILALTMYLIWRTWVAQSGEGVTVEQSELATYETRLKEIERDEQANRLDPEMAKLAKAEEARKLLKNQDNIVASVEAGNQPSGWWMTLGLFSIPLLSVLIYLGIGTPPENLITPEQPVVAEQSMEQLIAAAERRLETNPDDLQGWNVLAPVYLRQQNFEKAENAFRNIIRLSGEQPQTLSALGEILVAKSGGQVTSEALEMFERAIQLEPKSSNARFFLGLSALQNSNRDRARSIWQAMLDDAQGDEDWFPVMKERVAALDNTAVGVPSEDAAEEIANLSEGERQARILSMVAGLAARLEEDPEDKQGWIRLVRAYMVLGQTQNAEAAAKTATDRFSGDAKFIDLVTQALTLPEGVSN